MFVAAVVSPALACVLDIPLNLTTDTNPAGTTSMMSASTTDADTAPGPLTEPGGSGDETATGATSSESGAPPEAPCCAQQDAPTSTATGTTVHGPVTLPWAWYGLTGPGCEGRINAFLYADPPPSKLCTSNVGTYLLVTLYEEAWPDGFTGTGPVNVEIFMGLDAALTNGEITIDSLDEFPAPNMCEPDMPLASAARFTFSLSILTADWDLSGEVSAVYCPECDVPSCP